MTVVEVEEEAHGPRGWGLLSWRPWSRKGSPHCVALVLEQEVGRSLHCGGREDEEHFVSECNQDN